MSTSRPELKLTRFESLPVNMTREEWLSIISILYKHKNKEICYPLAIKLESKFQRSLYKINNERHA